MKAKNTKKKSLKRMLLTPLIILYTFFQETQPQFGDDPGFAPEIFFQDRGVFSSIAVPGVPSVEGDTMIITGDHTFPSTVGFIAQHTYRDGPELSGKGVGEPGFQVDDKQLTFVIVGDQAFIKERAENMKNRPLIILFQDPQSSSTRLQQIGTATAPCVVSAIEQTSGNLTKGGMKAYKITVTCTEPIFDYMGVVTMNS